jgi:hypothetical protein
MRNDQSVAETKGEGLATQNIARASTRGVPHYETLVAVLETERQTRKPRNG